MKEEGEEKQFPSIGKQLVNFTSAAIRHTMSGFGEVEDETYNQRMNECLNCEHYNRRMDRCYKCGCKCQTKASWPTSECPIGKWKKGKKAE
jgi:hypothetical protein